MCPHYKHTCRVILQKSEPPEKSEQVHFLLLECNEVWHTDVKSNFVWQFWKVMSRGGVIWDMRYQKPCSELKIPRWSFLPNLPPILGGCHDYQRSTWSVVLLSVLIVTIVCVSCYQPVNRFWPMVFVHVFCVSRFNHSRTHSGPGGPTCVDNEVFSSNEVLRINPAETTETIHMVSRRKMTYMCRSSRIDPLAHTGRRLACFWCTARAPKCLR